MNLQSARKSAGWGNAARSTSSDGAAADVLLRVADCGLCGVICVAPFFFGGRHDLGRLVLVALIAVTAAAWFIRQAILPTAEWTRTAIHGVLLVAAGMLVLQLIPLPPTVIAILSPRTAELLPLWMQAVDIPAHLGTWQTLSLMPHATAKSLAIFVSYCLLFLVVIGRIQTAADVRRLLHWIAASSMLMAGFGLLQYFASNGRFFWFYEHPHRTTEIHICGSFINRNHFASFLVLGVGPLAACLLELMQANGNAAVRQPSRPSSPSRFWKYGVAAALALVVFAALCSLSRGGAMALLTAATVFVGICVIRRLVDSRYAYGLGAFAVVVVGLLSFYGYNEVAQRLDDFTVGSLDSMDQLQGRRKIWAANAAAIQAGWLAGSGAGTHAEIYPVYLPEYITREYTHAENGYLQVTTENGVVGLVLLVAGIGICGSWCLVCFSRTTTTAETICFAAVVAGIAASVVHSAVDFVWYIPACMSVTVILAGCLLRLSQFARSTGEQSVGRLALPRLRWLEMSAAVVLVSAWTVYTYVGPGVAAIYWDRYLRASVDNSEMADEQMSNLLANESRSGLAADEALNDVMLRLLEQAVAWDPQFARAQLRLASTYVARFELRQQRAENAMALPQIRDAAVASQFASNEERAAWLRRAFGDNSELLVRADAASRRAVEICPLQGEAYVLLAATCFLHGGGQADVDALFSQSLRVRPFDGDVLFEVGRQKLMAGDPVAGIELWKKCFVDHGPHQMKIVFLRAGRVPAEVFLSEFRPNWLTLREIWARYREFGQPQDWDTLITYAASAAHTESLQAEGTRPMWVWYSLAEMYTGLGRTPEALASLERAYAFNSRHFTIRHALAQALLAEGRYAEAESHVRWCLARRPEQKSLTAALKSIAKHRLAEREVARNGLPPVAGILVK